MNPPASAPLPSPGWFAARMLVAYVALHYGYGLIPDQWLASTAYLHGFTQPSAALINTLAGGEQVLAVENRIVSAGAVLEVVRGCDGSGALFLLVAAVVAFKAPWRLRALGVLGGAALVYWLNLLRLVGLYFVAAHHPARFEALHEYFVPGLLVVMVMLFFIGWTSLVKPPGDPGLS